MASLKNHHQNQENVLPELRHKQTKSVANNPQKRAILGDIDNNKSNPTRVNVAKGKQPLRESTNIQNVRKQAGKAHIVVPPITQFQAFNVYEDEEASKQFISEPTDQDLENASDAKASRDGPTTPMSIDKSVDENNPILAQEIILKNRNLRDVFFEVEEYRDEIYAYLRERELRHRPKPGYIQKQPDVTDTMRAILVDWLVEVVEEYKMHTETLYLAVNFIDRFLSYMSVVRAKLQLVGTAAMFLASKYEEIIPPDVSEFVYITDDTYDKGQVIRMEHLILKVLGFDLSVPTPLSFINAMCISAKLTEKTLYMAMYLSELALLDVEPYLQFLPSTIAAAAIAVARHTLGEEAWDLNLHKATGYSLRHLQKAIFFLQENFVKVPVQAQRAIPDKYKHSKYLQVSTLEPNLNPINFDSDF